MVGYLSLPSLRVRRHINLTIMQSRINVHCIYILPLANRNLGGMEIIPPNRDVELFYRHTQSDLVSSEEEFFKLNFMSILFANFDNLADDFGIKSRY